MPKPGASRTTKPRIVSAAGCRAIVWIALEMGGAGRSWRKKVGGCPQFFLAGRADFLLSSKTAKEKPPQSFTSAADAHETPVLSCPVLSCLGFSLILLASEAHATVVLSNLGETNLGPGNGQGVALTDVGYENSMYVGSSFVAGAVAGNTWNLDSATLSMDDANPGTTGNFVVGIYANNTSGVPDPRPGALIGTLSGSLSPTTAANYTYTATPGSIQLTSGQTYWLVAGAPNTTGSGESYRWNLSSTTNYTTQSSGWSVNPALAVAVFDSNYQSDTGSWTDNPVATNDNVVFRTTSTPGPATNDYGIDGFLQFSLSATAVSAAPEPSKAAFVLFGLLSLWLPRKRSSVC